MAQWIDGYALEIGQVGFLAEHEGERIGDTDRWSLREHPLRTNQSHEPRLNGWCGTTNNVAAYARGLARVVRVAANGRALVVRLVGDERDAALKMLGYPSLA